MGKYLYQDTGAAIGQGEVWDMKGSTEDISGIRGCAFLIRMQENSMPEDTAKS